MPASLKLLTYRQCCKTMKNKSLLSTTEQRKYVNAKHFIGAHRADEKALVRGFKIQSSSEGLNAAGGLKSKHGANLLAHINL